MIKNVLHSAERFTACGGDALLVQTPAGAGRTIASHSHFNEPIPTDGMPHGYSRKWGDAPVSTQRAVLSTILNEGRHAGLSLDELAVAIAVARVESGFNPDAAATTTSAAGVGQLVDQTASNLGVAPEQRFHILQNVRAMLTQLSRDIGWAKANGDTSGALAYARYHDGPQLNAGGLTIGETKVVPWASRARDFLGCIFGAGEP